jgi:hypothetical protein
MFCDEEVLLIQRRLVTIKPAAKSIKRTSTPNIDSVTAMYIPTNAGMRSTVGFRIHSTIYCDPVSLIS